MHLAVVCISYSLLAISTSDAPLLLLLASSTVVEVCVATTTSS